MNSSRVIFMVIFLAAVTLLALALPFLPLPEEPGTGLWVFLGRFHPLLLHFPIVLVLLTLTFEGLDVYQTLRQRKNGTSSPRSLSFLIGPLLAVSVISTLTTFIGGYLLFRSGEYQGELVRNHLWGGVWLILTLNGAAFYYWRSRSIAHNGNKIIYQALLFTSGIMVIFTSHLGGSITHGQDFLTEHMPTLRTEQPAPVEEKKPEELLIFQDLILPVLEDKCQSCHNRYKSKGGLQMTTFADLQKGGKSEKPLLVAQNPKESELYHRITLPEDHEDKMPPPEKEAMNVDEITLIRWWISSGAGEEMQLGAEPPDSIRVVIERFLPRLYQSQRLKIRQQEEMESLASEMEAFGKKLGLVIRPDPAYPGYFGVSMTMPPASIDNNTVSKLKPYAQLFSKLSLPGSEIDDDALFEIGSMTNLRELYLPKTAITGSGLVYLKGLSQLETINLSNSCLSNEGVLSLVQLPPNKTVYVFGAEVDTLVLSALRKHVPELEILEEEGTYY